MIRDYSHFNRAYVEILRQLLTDPDHQCVSRKGDGLNELIDYSFRLSCPKNCFATCRDMSMKYLEGELDFYLSGSPFLADIEKHSKFWRGVSDDDRTINSNYGKLLLHDRNVNNWTQFEYAKSTLVRNSDSKKSVMVIYGPDHGRYSNDNPCTMYLQYFIRDNKLSLYVKMRSSDVWFGLPYDVPFFILLLYKMQKELLEFYPNLEIGTYNHQSGSLHLYDRNMERANEIVTTQNFQELAKCQDDIFIIQLAWRI